MAGKEDTVDFIGIGQGKSGSTWVSECLRQHPNVLFSSEKSRKELKFFCVGRPWSNYHKGIDWYLEQFPSSENGKIRGEFCPRYIVDPMAHMKIREHFPGCKILVTLRNPADFVYSLYHWEGLSLYFSNYPERFEDALKLPTFKADFLDQAFHYKHLMKYYNAFPAENIHVMTLDDIKSRPATVVRSLFRFLNIDEAFAPTVINKEINKSKKTKSVHFRNACALILKLSRRISYRSYCALNDSDRLHALYEKINWKRQLYPAMSDRTRRYLSRHFHDDVCRLEDLIQRDLSMWKTVGH